MMTFQLYLSIQNKIMHLLLITQLMINLFGMCRLPIIRIEIISRYRVKKLCDWRENNYYKLNNRKKNKYVRNRTKYDLEKLKINLPNRQKQPNKCNSHDNSLLSIGKKEQHRHKKKVNIICIHHSLGAQYIQVIRVKTTVPRNI